MGICKCLNCNETKLQAKKNLNICKECDDELFPIIKKFIDENPTNNAQTIIDGTNLHRRIVLNYLHSDSFNERINSDIKTKKCDSCGKEYFGSGTTCKNCLEGRKNDLEKLNQIMNALNEGSSTHEEKRNQGMRYFK